MCIYVCIHIYVYVFLKNTTYFEKIINLEKYRNLKFIHSKFYTGLYLSA